MLILSRKIGEAIVVANDIVVRIIDIKGGQVRLGVQAPGEVSVHREEIYQRILEENKKAALEAPDDLSGVMTVFGRKSQPSPDGREP